MRAHAPRDQNRRRHRPSVRRRRPGPAHGRARDAAGSPTRTAEWSRIEHGRPRYGIDLDDTVIPQEAGLNERAVSFTKGCYVGQETVARLFYRGKPNRRLRGLRLPAGAAGDGSSPTGTARSAGDELRRLAPASAHRARARPTRGAGRSLLTLGADGRRRVVALPFAAESGTNAPRGPPGGGSAGSARQCGSRCDSSYVETIRSSSISSGGTCAPRSPLRPARAIAISVRRMSSCAISGQLPKSTSRPPDDQSASNRGAVGCGASTSRGREWRRQQHAVDAVQDRSQPRVSAAQRLGALVALPPRRGRHLTLDMLEQRARGRSRPRRNSPSASSSRRR